MGTEWRTSCAMFDRPDALARELNMLRRVIVDVDLSAVAAHLSKEDARTVTEREAREWLIDAGFAPAPDGRWIVTEADLGQLDPTEVRSLDDATDA